MSRESVPITSEWKMSIGGETVATVKANYEMDAGEALAQIFDAMMMRMGRMEQEENQEECQER